MLPFVGQLIGALVRTVLGDALFNALFGGGQPNLQGIVSSVETVAQSVTWLADVLDDTFRREQSALADLQNQFTDAGNDVAAIGNQLYWCFNWTYRTVIPGALDWLYHEINSAFIKPLQREVTTLQTQERFLRLDVNAIERYDTRYVTPHINQWIAWYAYWRGWPRTAVETLQGWLQDPSKFGRFAAPAVAGPLVGYLGDKAQATLLDALAAELLTAFPDDIGAFVTFAGTLLATPVPDRFGP